MSDTHLDQVFENALRTMRRMLADPDLVALRGPKLSWGRPTAANCGGIFVPEEQRAPHLAAAPAVFEALHWGSKVVGVRIELAQANPRTVKLLLLQSWKRKAPKRLAASVSEEEE